MRLLYGDRLISDQQQIGIVGWREIAAVAQSASYQQMAFGCQYRTEVGYELERLGIIERDGGSVCRIVRIVDAEDVGIGLFLQRLVILADSEEVSPASLAVGCDIEIDDAVALAHHRNGAGCWQQCGLCAAEANDSHLACTVFDGH